MNPFKLIENLINEHGSSSILKERLLLLKDELTKVEKERTDLHAKVSELEEKVRKLNYRLETEVVSNEFTEYLGGLFKRDKSGLHMPVLHCPKCKIPMWNPEPAIFPYECSGCKFALMFHEDLSSAADRLNKQ